MRDEISERNYAKNREKYKGDLETIYNLIQELPDKSQEKEKIGFRQAANELYINKN